MAYPDYSLRLTREQAEALRAAATDWAEPAAGRSNAEQPGLLARAVQTLRDLLLPKVGGPPGLESLIVPAVGDRRIEDGSPAADAGSSGNVQRDEPGWRVVGRAPRHGSRRGVGR